MKHMWYAGQIPIIGRLNKSNDVYNFFISTFHFNQRCGVAAIRRRTFDQIAATKATWIQKYFNKLEFILRFTPKVFQG